MTLLLDITQKLGICHSLLSSVNIDSISFNDLTIHEDGEVVDILEFSINPYELIIQKQGKLISLNSKEITELHLNMVYFRIQKEIREFNN